MNMYLFVIVYNLPSHIKEVTSIDTFKKLINNL